MSATNQPDLDEATVALTTPALPAPHHKYPTVCVNCIASGYTPAAPQTIKTTPHGTTTDESTKDNDKPVYCGGCDRNLIVNPTPTLDEAFEQPTDLPVAHPDHPTACTRCIARGFIPPETGRRRDIVIDNCEFYLLNGVGLTEAAEREGYGDRSHLDSVLRRWGRLDLSHALAALDPVQVRERL